MSLFAIQAAADKFVADMIQAAIKQDPKLQFQWWFPLVESVTAVEFHQNQDWFIKVDKDKSGTLDAKEIVKAKFPGDIKIDETTTKRLIRVFDVDCSGSIGFIEFLALYNFVKLCLDTFKHFDSDKGGSLDNKEMAKALPALGFNCSKRSIDTLLKLNSCLGKKVSKNQFVAAAAYLGQCRSIYQRTFDMKRTEIDNREFDKFVDLVLSLVD
ncbi:programmed cell death protein, putative [Entamoeba invadens IP1]|uniref:Programmed cell death protein, putative n=2 Tax=Entamoeba invadens TaxID=33085 RepID=A0A0A1U0P7_ENTIV|nr:programmed cell death protein, putative [Entamoeba invadens IP1]BAN41029.1 programmed cell death protein, putative [Entamoeba invadens]ELP87447.1 programmed cell death protein, putative [Entamoeba invadens IP1]BAN41210.1 programmed cell death protein, putative [Entamoeba invadens]BAN41238.1 programmed cell death protein, putative [Entamoeba invadens]BAN41970.1 programmed cell death protein, putative [Entamoeba invadens]|eukprot:XP_004254218.1 programmed cell death protein, putative [Entamoeba invadens IP1]